MSKRLRLGVDLTLRQSRIFCFPSQFIPYKKERVNQRLALLVINQANQALGFLMTHDSGCCCHTGSRHWGFIS